MSPVDTSIQKREYQEIILAKLKENFYSNPKRHTIAEVDTGLGKRVITYLLIKEALPDQKFLLLLHSSSSYAETIHYFTQEYGGFEGDYTIQGISSRTPSWLRSKILSNLETRIIVATPQTFANAFNRTTPHPVFDVIIINEIDKIVRRQGDERLLIFPYNQLIPIFISQGAWLIGMTGTIRDSHLLFNTEKDTIEVQRELISLDKRIPNLHLIQMDKLIEETDIKKYIDKSISYVHAHAVEASPELKQVLELIDYAINELRTDIIEETQERNPTLLESIPSKHLALVSGMLNNESHQGLKYQGLLLIRKYCTAMQTKKYRKFLFRLKDYGLTKDLIYSLPYRNNKIDTVMEQIQSQPNNSKTVILCSFIDTAEELAKFIHNLGIDSFLITGKVRNKIEILNAFKSNQNKSVMVMTSVGERDIDLPQANLIILYDTVNTVKTAYQRMKRTRGGRVIFLYYANTFEERKIKRLLSNIREKYPWSSIINSF